MRKDLVVASVKEGVSFLGVPVEIEHHFNAASLIYL
jgi:hypothetical protein